MPSATQRRLACYALGAEDGDQKSGSDQVEESERAATGAGAATIQAPPASTDEGRLRVFISYSRKDFVFTDQLEAALTACGFDCALDRHDISGGDRWNDRVRVLISDSDTIVFVLTPASAASEICALEVEESVKLGKRIIPVVSSPLGAVKPPDRLGALNYIFFYPEQKDPGSGFGTGLKKLVDALRTDLGWLRLHTRYLQRATEWVEGGRPANRLLLGDDVTEAKDWIAHRPQSAAQPTPAQLDFILASEQEERARSDAERQQLDAIKVAQAAREVALQKAEAAIRRAQEEQARRKKIQTLRNIALMVVSVLVLLALVLTLTLRSTQREALSQKNQANAILFSAIKIIQINSDQKIAQELVKLFESAAEAGNSDAMVDLGLIYSNGSGIGQDIDKARYWYEKAANANNTLGMFALGVMYDKGQGLPQDYTMARVWYEKAAARSHPSALYYLGVLYQCGHGVAPDPNKAMELFRAAADKGDQQAKDVLRSGQVEGCAEAKT